jgi:hypothetical protein
MDLTPKEITAIDIENDRFFNELNVWLDNRLGKSKHPRFCPIIKFLIRYKFISKAKDVLKQPDNTTGKEKDVPKQTENTIEKEKARKDKIKKARKEAFRHIIVHGSSKADKAFSYYAQMKYNIFLRFGCEILYFNDTAAIQPMVTKTADKNYIVKPPGTGEKPLHEYFKELKKLENLKKLEKLENKERKNSADGKDKNIFNSVRGDDFFKGKEDFLKKFKLSEYQGYDLPIEYLYYSYYIAWEPWKYDAKSANILESKDPLAVGDFFWVSIFTKEIDRMFNVIDKCDKYNKTGKYTDAMYKTFESMPHSFNNMDVASGNDKKINSLIYKLKKEYYSAHKLRKEYIVSGDTDVVKSVKRFKQQFERLLEALMAVDTSAEKEDFRELKENITNANDPLGEIKALDSCVENRTIKMILNALGLYAARTESFSARRLKLTEMSTETPIGNSEEPMFILDNDKVKNPYDDGGIKALLTDTEIKDKNILFIFETVFTKEEERDYLGRINKYISTKESEFRQDIEDYACKKNDDKTQNGLRVRYKEYLEAQQPPKPCGPKNIAHLKENIIKILDRMYSEYLVSYGRRRLKETFRYVFQTDIEGNNTKNEKFLVFIDNLVDTSYNNFKNDFRNLLTEDENTGENSWFLEKYQKIIMQDDIDVFGVPPSQKKKFPQRGLLKFANQVYLTIKKDFKELRDNYLSCFYYNTTVKQNNPKEPSGENSEPPPDKTEKDDDKKRSVLDHSFFKVFCDSDSKEETEYKLELIFGGRMIRTVRKILEDSNA